MSSLRERNLDVLRQRFPHVALCVETLPDSTNALSLVRTKSNDYTLVVSMDGKETALHSRYDPVNEATRWALQSVPARGSALLIVGWGLGYHVMAWLREHGTIPAAVIIYEPNAEWFYASLDVTDLSPLLQYTNVTLVVGRSPEVMYQAMLKQIEALFSQDYRIVALPFAGVYPQEATQVVQQEWVRIKVTRASMLRHMETLGYTCQKNIVRNLGTMLRSRFPKEYKHRAKGLPALVVAAGPSLDKTIDAIQQAETRCVIFCCDTVWPVLRAHNILPDVVITKDSTELNLTHFSNTDDSEKVTLAYDPQIQPELAQRWRGPLLCMPNRNAMLHRYLRDLAITVDDRLPLSTNVAIAAFNLAVHMGCAPVILTGLDLCFAAGSGLSHASGTALRSSTDADLSTAQMTYERDGHESQVEVMTVTGIDGEPYPTTPTMFEALRLLEQWIVESGIECIDATEGGARIQGTTLRPLREVLESLPEGKTETVFNFEQRSNRSQESLTTDLVSIVDHLKQCGDAALRGRSIIEQSNPETRLAEVDSLRVQIEEGYRIYHELQSALEPVMAIIGRDGYWEEALSTDDMTARYLHYFTEVERACTHFVPIYEEQIEIIKKQAIQ